MKSRVDIFKSSLPLAMGLIICMTALAFLVAFTGQADFSDLSSEAIQNLMAFFVLMIVGVPTLVLGIERVSAAD